MIRGNKTVSVETFTTPSLPPTKTLLLKRGRWRERKRHRNTDTLFFFFSFSVWVGLGSGRCLIRRLLPLSWSLVPLCFVITNAMDFDSSAVDSWTVGQVGQWLQFLDLGQYRKKFTSNSISGAELVELDQEDLVQLGITTLGHRKRILTEIKNLQANKEALVDNSDSWSEGSDSNTSASGAASSSSSSSSKEPEASSSPSFSSSSLLFFLSLLVSSLLFFTTKPTTDPKPFHLMKTKWRSVSLLVSLSL